MDGGWIELNELKWKRTNRNVKKIGKRYAAFILWGQGNT